MSPEIVVETGVTELDCKYNVADVKVNGDDGDEKYNKELALIVFYWFTYNTKFEAVKGVYEAAQHPLDLMMCKNKMNVLHLQSLEMEMSKSM